MFRSRFTILSVAWAVCMGCSAAPQLVAPEAGSEPEGDGGFNGVIDPPESGSGRFCDLPGSVQFTRAGMFRVSGGEDAEKLAFLQLPDGFCAHYFANVGNARQLRFAPGGELFVASPTALTTGGGSRGNGAIMVLADDDHDGRADSVFPPKFLGDISQTQGLLFANDHFYYQDGTTILRRPYKAGDRKPSEPVEQIADITIYTSPGHWPKTLDQADDGTIYVGNGGDQGESCDLARPFHGGILKLDGSAGAKPIAKGFRNPIAVRCQRGHNNCFAVELAMDYSADFGGREKLVPIREGDDWGFPCCFTNRMAAPNLSPTPDCSGVTSESVSFLIGDTPFGVDFEAGRWPDPYAGAAFVAVHGAYSSWSGARLAVILTDRGTGLPHAGSSMPNVSNGSMNTFAGGWDDGSHAHGRPSAVTFAADGRLFLANDNNGDIIWIAPIDLHR